MDGVRLSLVGFNDASNTIRLYKRPCQGCVQTAVLSGNYKTKSAVLVRFLFSDFFEYIPIFDSYSLVLYRHYQPLLVRTFIKADHSMRLDP